MTGLPAEIYGLGSKGILQNGYDADPVPFDYAALTDNATYAEPAILAGIDCVIVGGKIVYCKGRWPENHRAS